MQTSDQCLLSQRRTAVYPPRTVLLCLCSGPSYRATAPSTLSSFAAFTYNTVANVMTVFATAEYGFTDLEAGEIYGSWGLMTSVWAMSLGPVIDVLGCRKAGILGFTIYAVARSVIVFVNDRDVFKFTVVFVSPLAEGLAGLSSSMYGLGIKRYSSIKNRNFAYAMMYAIQCVGGALGGFVIDGVSGSTWCGREKTPFFEPFAYQKRSLLRQARDRHKETL